MAASGDIGILTTDRDLVIQSWDDWLAAVTSVAPADARGRRLSELAPQAGERRYLARVEETLATGAVQVLSPAFHRSLLPCPPRTPSTHYSEMQQRITIGPLLDAGRIAGLLITVQDVTAQLEEERRLAADLASADPETRARAAAAIAASRRVESFEGFAPALGSDDWRVRGDAVRGLAAAADRELLRALVVTLQKEHRNFSTLSSALKLLAVTDVDATAPLAELLQDADADLRIQAALALGEQHQPAAAAPLIQALQDPDPNVRFHAIEALGRLRAEPAIDPLLAIVESRDFFLAFAALDALALIRDSRVAPRLVPLLEDADLRDGVAHALGQLGDGHVVSPLVGVLNRTPEAAPAVVLALAAIADALVSQGQDDRDVVALIRETLGAAGRAGLLAAIPGAPPETLRAIARVLGWIPGPDIIAALTRIAGGSEARAEAVESLIRHGEPSVDAFVSLLDADDRDVRSTAIAALGRLGSRRATPALVAQLDADAPTAIAAGGALARIGDPAAFEPLLALVGHADPAVRQAVIGALNSIGHPGMPERVTRLLGDEDPLVRESAVRIAGYFGYSEALDVVVGRVNDPVEAVRVAAIEHLPFFDGGEVLPHLASALQEETARARAAAARALARSDSAEALPLLTAALADADAWVRYYAARALGERGAAGEIPGLLRLAESDPSIPVRIAAIDALGALKASTAAEPLLRCVEAPEPEIAAAAIRAVGRIDGPNALEALRSAARGDDGERRLAAIEGLESLGTAGAVAQLEWLAASDGGAQVSERAVQGLTDIALRRAPGADEAVDALLALCAVPERRESAAAGLAQLPVELLPQVARGLEHSDPAVRRRTVDVLARVRRPEATRLMARAFADADPGVRETASVAVLRLGTAVFDDRLRALREQDPSKAVRRAAAAALASRRSGS